MRDRHDRGRPPGAGGCRPFSTTLSGMHAIQVIERELEPYAPCFDAMRAYTEARTPDTPDQIWLVEHPPVYTLGQAGDPAHLLSPDASHPGRQDRSWRTDPLSRTEAKSWPTCCWTCAAAT